MKNMKKIAIKLITFLAVFIVSLYLANVLLNRGNTDMTATMSSATLPVIYMNVNDEYINPLHGYTTVMEGNYLRGPITPLMANREISFRADLYGAVIAGVGFEVRTMDMQRLIEDTVVNDFHIEEDSIFGTVSLKDLIDEDTEYMLIIKLTTSSGNVIRYYARIINRAELALNEKMTFVRDFSDRTFDKEAAAEIKQYMESNSEGDNSSFGYVNIHSSFNQLTWGDLQPQVVTAKNMELLEIDGSSASILLTYQVEILGENHNVSEFFRIKRGNKRMYLMEYERIINQIFDEEKNVVVNGKILHGILNEKPRIVESESGGVLCFVQQNQLYSYNPTSGVLARVFAFCDADNDDARTRYNHHGVKPLSIDESGNINFIVYGYMNRGIHEGEVGVAMYYYDYALNTIEEQFYLPYTKSYEMLKQDIDNLAYINQKNWFYIYVDGTVYCVKGDEKSAEVIQNNISDTRFVSSEDQSMIAWQTGESIQEYTEIKLFALDWVSPSSIMSEKDNIIIPFGFMNRDLIYGVARKDDLTKGDTGRTVIPMYAVRIQDKNGNILKEYSQEGKYVTGAVITENQIIMDRLVKDETTGEYQETNQDQIMDNAVASAKKNVYSSVVTEETETTYQTILRREPSSDKPKLVNPKEVLFEDNRNIELDTTDSLARFYVYAKNDIVGIFTDAAEAVNEAYDIDGVVVDKNCSYIWEAENRKGSTQIAKIDIPEAQKLELDQAGDVSDDTSEDVMEDYMVQYDANGNLLGGDEAFAGEDVYAQGARTQKLYGYCLDAMLQGDDVYKDTMELIKEDSITGVLKTCLENRTVLDLTGCDMSAVLYYVSRGYPVMVLCPDKEAVVIVGYDSKNTILYNPMEGTIAKMGMSDSRAWFEANGNKYISYVP